MLTHVWGFLLVCGFLQLVSAVLSPRGSGNSNRDTAFTQLAGSPSAFVVTDAGAVGTAEATSAQRGASDNDSQRVHGHSSSTKSIRSGAPLCDSRIVDRICSRIGDERTRRYVKRAKTWRDKSVVHAGEISKHFMVSIDSSARLLEFLARRFSLTDFNSAFSEDSRRANVMSCRDLCSMVMKTIPSSVLPPFSDVGCLRTGSSEPACDLDLRPSKLETIILPNSTRLDETGATASVEKTRQEEGHFNSLPDSLEDLPVTKGSEMLLDLAELFHIYPVAKVDMDGSPAQAWREDAVRAGILAKAYTNSALDAFAGHSESGLLERWFGSSSSRTRTQLRRVLNGLRGVLTNSEYRFPGNGCNDANPSDLLHVEDMPATSGRSRGKWLIHVCDRYINVSLPEKVGAILRAGSARHLDVDTEPPRNNPPDKVGWVFASPSLAEGVSLFIEEAGRLKPDVLQSTGYLREGTAVSTVLPGGADEGSYLHEAFPSAEVQPGAGIPMLSPGPNGMWFAFAD
eukprot:TRINITY_DN62700_c0_g1_i1.p1 TRINITY_DN62700_c0_g1~~TRINITY_DN62700_c0_g1_i1.p1  ORF type:complete len:513 (+),score=62.12 TRINITY_DN62700_c0_g1_i1:102-1640(+)